MAKFINSVHLIYDCAFDVVTGLWTLDFRDPGGSEDILGQTMAHRDFVEHGFWPLDEEARAELERANAAAG